MSDEDEAPTGYADPLAERAHAYGALIMSIADIQDETLRAEGMLMLAALRESVRTGPKGELRKIK